MAPFDVAVQPLQPTTDVCNINPQPAPGNQSARQLEYQQRHVQFLTQQQSSRYSQSSCRYQPDIPHKPPTFAELINRVNPSAWMVVSLGLLLLSSLIFVVSFVTNSWGIMVIYAINPGSASDGSSTSSAASFALENSHWNISAFVAASQFPSATAQDKGASQPARSQRMWYFGLWRCCRDDGLCLGTRWPAFYSAARTFAVLALFGHALSFAWIFGHTLEKLLDYDPCTMMSLVAACFSTTIFVTISVCVYGVLWPTQFHQMVHDASPNYGSETSLGYSFFLAVVTAPLTAASGVCAVIDFHGSWRDFEAQHNFADYDDNETDEEELVDGASADSNDVLNSETAPSGSTVAYFEAVPTGVRCPSSSARAAKQNTPTIASMDTSAWTEESLV